VNIAEKPQTAQGIFPFFGGISLFQVIADYWRCNNRVKTKLGSFYIVTYL